MIRFRRRRRKWPLDRQVHLRSVSTGKISDVWSWGNKRDLQDGWRVLQQRCTDRASRVRLAHLLNRLGSFDRGAKESALAELELAVLLVQAGCAVTFLPESKARTADLECALGHTRVFVEVTALVGRAHTTRRRAAVSRSARIRDSEEEEGDHVLIHRLLARISQKARQLSDYTDPVVLSITVPHRDDSAEELDLKRLAGAITVLLPLHGHVSAVLLALWDVPPMPSRSGVRLSNVHVVERSAQQRTHPRVRLLIVNPSASTPLRSGELQVLKALL